HPLLYTCLSRDSSHTRIYTLSLHDALPILAGNVWAATTNAAGCARPEDMTAIKAAAVQQKLMVAALSCNAIQLYNNFVTAYQKEIGKSTRLNSSHLGISYAVFCLKKKRKNK